MGQLQANLAELLDLDRGLALLRAAFLVVAGLVAGQLLGRSLGRLSGKRVELQQALMLRRIATYLVFSVFLVSALHQLGFNLGVLLGAAGVLSVAIGIASQTSASNLISGLFLIAEHPFGIDDVIDVGGTTGVVLSIDLLSIKLRTFDNIMVRIPNETLIKVEVRNLTRFPIRRADLFVGVAYREDLEHVRDLLFSLADRNPLCLQEPRPFFQVKAFGDSAIELQFSPWATRETYFEMKGQMLLQIKRAFDEEGIEIPFPHRTLYAGSRSEPIELRWADRRVGEGHAPEETDPPEDGRGL